MNDEEDEAMDLRTFGNFDLGRGKAWDSCDMQLDASYEPLGGDLVQSRTVVVSPGHRPTICTGP